MISWMSRTIRSSGPQALACIAGPCAPVAASGH